MLRRSLAALLLATTCLLTTPVGAQQGDAEVTRLTNEAVRSYQEGRYREALDKARMAHERAIAILGERHPKTLATLNNHALLLETVGRAAEAEPLFKRALDLVTEILGEKHPNTLTSLGNYAGALESLGRAAEAEPLFKHALDIRTEIMGEKHPDTLNSLNNYAGVLKSLGRTAEAEPLYKRALDLRTEILGARHPDTLISLNNYATTLDELGRTAEAEPLYKRALDLATEVLGEKHPDTLSSLNNYAFVLQTLGRAAEAEPLYKRALDIRTEILGEKHPNTLTSVGNYAGALENLGRAAEAEPLFKRTLDIRAEVLGEKHPDTLISLHNYAGILETLGRAVEAEHLYKRALDLATEVLGEKHPDTLSSLNNYAFVLQTLGRAAEAEPPYKRALDIRTEVLGEKHPDTLTSLSNYASVVQALGRAAEAEPLYKRALDIRTKVLGEKHPNTLQSLNNYAFMLQALGRNVEAEPFFKRAVEGWSAVLGERHPDTLAAALNHIFVLIRLDRIDEALSRLERGVARLHDWSGAEMRAMSRDAGRRGLMARSGNWANVILSVALRYPSPRAHDLAAKTVLRWKQRATEEDAVLARALRGSGDPAIRAKAVRVDELSRDVASLARNDRGGGYAARAEELDGLMRDLRRDLRDPALYTPAQFVTPAMIADRLPQNSALVEFRAYRKANFAKGELGEYHLAAVTITPGQPPLVYDVGPMADVAALVAPAVQGDRAAAAKLYAAAFGPATKRLKGVETLYIAPDGPLWDISPAVLRAGADADFLIRDTRIHLLATGRDLLARDAGSDNAGVMAIGGVIYGDGAEAPPKPAPVRHAAADPRGADPMALLRDAGAALQPLKFLPNSGREAGYLKTLYELGPIREAVTVLDGTDASEGALKHLAKPPKVLHLATHGDYRAMEAVPDRPEVMSWVALAGANNGLKGIPDADGEDGLLTALEAAALPLQGTRLVVLSACETGSGAKDYSEGLIGLTRAFRIAGARNVLAALRPVPDGLTAEFMMRFHDNWVESNWGDPHAALRETQLAFVDSDDPRKRDPGFWGAFVMIGP